MLRIGQVEATATQDGKYTDGSVAGGIAATRLRAAAFNAMQEELAHIVESAGLALDINDMTQVLKAIQKLTLSRANPFADIKSDGAAAISTALTNLGLPELLNKKFDKTGGTIKASSKAIDIVTGATDSGYIQISDENGSAIHQIGKISSDKILTLRNVAEDGTLTISGDSARFNGNLIAISATKYSDLTSSRNSNNK